MNWKAISCKYQYAFVTVTHLFLLKAVRKKQGDNGIYYLNMEMDGIRCRVQPWQDQGPFRQNTNATREDFEFGLG
jgi:hypothetical protein